MPLEGTVARSVREALECSVCYESFTLPPGSTHRPVVLPCRHVVCYHCATTQLPADTDKEG
jgi:hypothetical protein